MKQRNQIGKYTKKEDILNAKYGKTFVTPNNKNYVFTYRKEGKKYIFIIEYKDHKMQVTEHDFNTHSIDVLIETIERELNGNFELKDDPYSS